MWHWIIEGFEAALLGGLGVMSFHLHRSLRAARERQLADRAMYKDLYEKNARRWADHLKSRMH